MIENAEVMGKEIMDKKQSIHIGVNSGYQRTRVKENGKSETQKPYSD